MTETYQMRDTYRLVAIIATLLPQGFLIEPGVVAVPDEEVSSEVDVVGLVDVRDDKVIVPGFGTRGQLWIGESRL